MHPISDREDGGSGGRIDGVHVACSGDNCFDPPPVPPSPPPIRYMQGTMCLSADTTKSPTKKSPLKLVDDCGGNGGNGGTFSSVFRE
jgi:hypothetical protein